MTRAVRTRMLADLPPEMLDDLRRLAPLGRALFAADDEREALGMLDGDEREPTTEEAVARCAAVLMGDLPVPREDPRRAQLQAKLDALQIRLVALQIAALRGRV